MKTLSFFVIAGLCACSCSSTIHYQLIERTKLADETRIEIKGVVACKSISGIDPYRMTEMCKKACYDRAEALTAREMADDQRDGNKIMSVGYSRMMCHKM